MGRPQGGRWAAFVGVLGLRKTAQSTLWHLQQVCSTTCCKAGDFPTCIEGRGWGNIGARACHLHFCSRTRIRKGSKVAFCNAHTLSASQLSRLFSCTVSCTRLLCYSPRDRMQSLDLSFVGALGTASPIRRFFQPPPHDRELT